MEPENGKWDSYWKPSFPGSSRWISGVSFFPKTNPIPEFDSICLETPSMAGSGDSLSRLRCPSLSCLEHLLRCTSTTSTWCADIDHAFKSLVNILDSFGGWTCSWFFDTSSPRRRPRPRSPASRQGINLHVKAGWQRSSSATHCM